MTLAATGDKQPSALLPSQEIEGGLEQKVTHLWCLGFLVTSPHSEGI